MKPTLNPVARISSLALAVVFFSAVVPDALLAQPAERQALFGDLHLHTAMSFDAAASSTTLMPEDSYRFASGEEVEYFGRKVRRHVPLDFLAVTDHAEYMGVASDVLDPEGSFKDTGWGEKVAEARASNNPIRELMNIFSVSGFFGSEPPIEEFLDESRLRSAWQHQIQAAEKFNKPGTFSTLVAYEWSPMPGRAHMHRNVIFAGPDYPELPFSALDSQRPEDLWDYAETNRAQGMDSIMIPHNSNLSDGLMFTTRDSDGNSISAEYARRRLENERLVEITQNKGSSETTPEFAPTDEFADFELLEFVATEGEVDLRGGYVREAYKRGLEIAQDAGLNPFQFGLVGASDFHSGIAAQEEFNFPGGLGLSDDQSEPSQVLGQINPILGNYTTVLSSSGLTGVWAENNTREDIFQAMKRREVFATSGPRIRVRMFAGFAYPDGITASEEWVEWAYQEGVPMGSDLPAAVTTGKPRFLVHAMQDPDSGSLDRIQIIKIWEEEGTAREAIINVVWAGERAVANDGRLPAVGNSVDLATATFDNSIGAAELTGEWVDEDFDPDQGAVYYARVLEIPTPRWPTYLAVSNQLPIPDNAPATLQERAWTSPIFYSPDTDQ